MAKPLTPQNRILKARKFLEQARTLGKACFFRLESFQYTAQVKDLLRKGFELIKLIAHSVTASDEIKAEAAALIEELKSAETEILKKS